MVSKPEVLALVPARGGSKGIPRKNICDFAGAPLIAYSIAAGLQSQHITRVIVSTDDEEIAAIARQWGAETPFLRPAEFAQDDTTDLPVFQQALSLYGYEYFEALGKNNVMIESGSVALTKLETGECKAIMILEESVLKKRAEEGSKLSVIYPEDGVILIPSTVMTVAADRSANMNIAAAEAITDWLLSEAGQKFVLAGYMHSVFKGSKEIPFDSVDTDGLIEKDIGVDWVRTYTQRDEIQNAFQQAVTITK